MYIRIYENHMYMYIYIYIYIYIYRYSSVEGDEKSQPPQAGLADSPGACLSCACRNRGGVKKYLKKKYL